MDTQNLPEDSTIANGERACIWCGNPTSHDDPIEHIVPEAIGCPSDFILQDGEVCKTCNNGLAHLDQALVHDLEGFAFLAGIRRKRDRAPLIASYGNLRAEVLNGVPTYYFNMENHSVEISKGNKLPGFRGKERDVHATFKARNGKAEVSFNLEFGRSPKVARALIKLGAEYFCWAMGRELASQVIAGPVADFVRFGKGERPLILCNPDKSKYEHYFGNIGQVEPGNWYTHFRLAHFEVIVDLSPTLLSFQTISAEMLSRMGRNGWTTLPMDAISDARIKAKTEATS